jgi:hypothetical protein
MRLSGLLNGRQIAGQRATAPGQEQRGGTAAGAKAPTNYGSKVGVLSITSYYFRESLVAATGGLLPLDPLWRREQR